MGTGFSEHFTNKIKLLSTSEQSYTIIKHPRKSDSSTTLLVHTDHMSELYQSAYKPHQPTETPLLCVCEDIKRPFDIKNGTALIMLDLSATFDTIDHTILLHRLRHRYEISGAALKWRVISIE